MEKEIENKKEDLKRLIDFTKSKIFKDKVKNKKPYFKWIEERKQKLKKICKKIDF